MTFARAKGYEVPAKYLLIHLGGTAIGFAACVWMPWKLRVKFARFIYKITYVNPAQHPTFISFIENANNKYRMGKGQYGMYKDIKDEINKQINIENKNSKAFS